jgi:rare lipoprotein A
MGAPASLRYAVLCAALALAGCSSAPKIEPRPSATAPPATHKAGASTAIDLPALPPAGSGRGAYYQDDGPGENIPPGLNELPDADVRNEPLNPRSNRPYVVFGKTYTPIVTDQPFTQRGMSSWYGKKFHGQRTSSGEVYDMYKMTAAHPTLPIPSYARVTSLVSGKQVVVRINDRGPFHAKRIIDVSYTAALKLGLLGPGSHEVEVERILPAEIERMLAARKGIPEPTLALTPATALAKPPADIEALMIGEKPLPNAASEEQVEDGAPAQLARSTALATKGGVYIQLGAYTDAARAESVRSQLQKSGASLGGLEVVRSGDLHRLFGGPYASRAEASAAIRAVPPALKLQPLVVLR